MARLRRVTVPRATVCHNSRWPLIRPPRSHRLQRFHRMPGNRHRTPVVGRAPRGYARLNAPVHRAPHSTPPAYARLRGADAEAAKSGAAAADTRADSCRCCNPNRHNHPTKGCTRRPEPIPSRTSQSSSMSRSRTPRSPSHSLRPRPIPGRDKRPSAQSVRIPARALRLRLVRRPEISLPGNVVPVPIGVQIGHAGNRRPIAAARRRLLARFRVQNLVPVRIPRIPGVRLNRLQQRV
jgi:hypothetical protein